jgi:hypothetical protein
MDVVSEKAECLPIERAKTDHRVSSFKLFDGQVDSIGVECSEVRPCCWSASSTTLEFMEICRIDCPDSLLNVLPLHVKQKGSVCFTSAFTRAWARSIRCRGLGVEIQGAIFKRPEHFEWKAVRSLVGFLKLRKNRDKRRGIA